MRTERLTEEASRNVMSKVQALRKSVSHGRLTNTAGTADQNYLRVHCIAHDLIVYLPQEAGSCYSEDCTQLPLPYYTDAECCRALLHS